MARNGLPPPVPKTWFSLTSQIQWYSWQSQERMEGLPNFPVHSLLALPLVSTFVHDHFVHSPLRYCNYSFIISFFSLPPVPLHLTTPSFTHLLSCYKTVSPEVFQLLSYLLWLHRSLVKCPCNTEGTNSHNTLKKAEEPQRT